MDGKTKKIIFFIVEGPTDENALSPILKKIFQSEEVAFHVVHGDLTSEQKVTKNNIVKSVNAHIKEEMKRYGLSKKDVLKIVHLIDTDGAFIPSDRVIYGPNRSIEYLDNLIVVKNVTEIVNRNARKTRAVSALNKTTTVGGMPYSVHYFSRNLEHVLQNITKDIGYEDKINYADEFADKYKNDIAGFLSFINSTVFAVAGDYDQTWTFIMDNNNSLHRYCNLHLALPKEQMM